MKRPQELSNGRPRPSIGRASRREFIQRAAVAGIGVGALGRIPAVRGQNAPSETVRVAVMGVNSRGEVLAQTFARAPGCEVAYVCDVDHRAVEKTVATVSNAQRAQPREIGRASCRERV